MLGLKVICWVYLVFMLFVNMVNYKEEYSKISLLENINFFSTIFVLYLLYK